MIDLEQTKTYPKAILTESSMHYAVKNALMKMQFTVDVLGCYVSMSKFNNEH